MSSLSDSIQRIFKDRTSDPLAGTYATSWALFNWKPISIIIFQSELMSVRISHVESNYFQTPYSYCTRFGFPLIITFGWIYIYPFVRKKIYDYDQGTRSELVEIKRRHESGNWEQRFRSALFYITHQFQQQTNSRAMALPGDLTLQKGDLVTRRNNDSHLSLATAKGSHKQAVGMVIDVITEGYFLVQTEGTIDGILDDLKPDTRYYLSHTTPGKFSENPPPSSKNKFETLYSQEVFTAKTKDRIVLGLSEARNT